jgi:2-dehydropantoate 2-reductase
MKIAIVGAGAIGGLVGAKLALAGEQVTFLVRGASLAAVRANGIRLVTQDGSESIAGHVTATDDYAAAGPQDMVILAVKAQQMEAIAHDVPKLFGADTVVVTMQNGIPYWYFHRHGGALAGTVVRSVDPQGLIARQITPGRVIGCVVSAVAERSAPGVIRRVEGDRFTVGELDGSHSLRVAQVAQAFAQAGLDSPVVDDIRAALWLKLWGSLAFNPISALSRATLIEICEYPPTLQLVERLMQEGEQVAQALGVRFPMTRPERIEAARRAGQHRSSMLQDVEAGREPEFEAVVGAVAELGRLTGIATPAIDGVHALSGLLGRALIERKRSSGIRRLPE